MQKLDIDQFLAEKQIGIVGVSRSEQKLSNAVYKKLRESGYELYPVHPEMESLAGDKCLPSVLQLPNEVHTLMIVAGPDVTASVLREVSHTGINRIWVFPGKSNRPDIEQEMQTLRSTGVSVITGVCPFMFLEPVTSAHSIHRFFARLLGKYPK